MVKKPFDGNFDKSDGYGKTQGFVNGADGMQGFVANGAEGVLNDSGAFLSGRFGTDFEDHVKDDGLFEKADGVNFGTDYEGGNTLWDITATGRL